MRANEPRDIDHCVSAMHDGAPVSRCLNIYQDLLALHHALPQRYPHLLESVVHGPYHARYDILFAFPQQTLELDAGLNVNGASAAGNDFLHAFDHWWRTQQPSGPDGTGLPFRGGWFVFLGYELGNQIEPAVALPPRHGELPHAFAMRIPAALIRDHWLRQTFLMAEPGYEHLLDTMAADLVGHSDTEVEETLYPIVVDEDDPGAFLDGVRRIQDYIHAGDVFQVNLSRQWTAAVDSDVAPGVLYQRLRNSNPGPFAGLATYGDLAVISSSPERLVHTTAGGMIETRPIAGTRPRGSDLAADQTYSKTLLAHPKERAEHVMLIDLERNDLGRVSRPGSVEVNELMVLESYRHVHHIVSNIRGQLEPGTTPGQVMRAVFPGGTITGCPKVRCMQIIAELEQMQRGPYTGAMGYVNRDGSMDLNILIRTLWLHNRHISFRTGAGIVADSDPGLELEETRAKAKGLLLALTRRGSNISS